MLERFEQVVIIPTATRSGSNYFNQLLSSLRQVRIFGDPFKQWDWAKQPGSASQLLSDFLYQRASAKKKKHETIIGCKLSPQHLIDFKGGTRLSPTEIYNLHDNVKVICLIRENPLARYISEQLAIVNHSWVSNDKPHQHTKITVDLQQFQTYARAHQQIVDLYYSWFPNALFVTYQQLLDDHQSVFDNNICPFLGVDQQAVRARLIKQNPLSLAENIENLDEVYSAIRQWL